MARSLDTQEYALQKGLEQIDDAGLRRLIAKIDGGREMLFTGQIAETYKEQVLF